MIDKSTYLALKKELDCTKLIAVSKTQSIDAIESLYSMGQRDFGENRVQELLEKKAKLPSDINWHFIGHLQSNKVSEIVGKVFMIQSVDSIKLLRKIQSESEKSNIKTKVLLQMYIAQEESKFGLDMDEFEEIKCSFLKNEFSNIIFCGLMGMATNTGDTKIVTTEFTNIANMLETMKKENIFPNLNDLCIGMSGDYHIALKSGATMVRIGSKLF